MSEEIKIKVTAQADTSGIQKMRAEIDRLNKEAAQTDKRNADPRFAAGKRREALDKSKILESSLRANGATAEADALKQANAAAEIGLRLQQRHNMGYAEALKLGRQQVANQVAQREAAAAAAAMQKGGLLNHRAQNELLTAGRLMAEGQSPMRSMGSAFGQILPQMLKGMSGVAMAASAAVATVVAGGLAYVNSYIGAREKEESISNQRGAERSEDKRNLQHLRSWRASSSEAVDQAFAQKEKAEQAKDQRAELEHKTKLAWYNPMRWSDHLLGTDFRHRTFFGEKNDGQRAIDENEAGIARAERESKMAEAMAKKKFNEGEGGFELEMLRGQAKHSVAGLRQKRAAEEQLIWKREYDRVMNQVHDSGIASESAGLKVGERRHELSMNAAAGMVDARSGAGDILNAARVASGSLVDKSSSDRAIEALHRTVRANGDALTGRNFSPESW